MALTSVVIRRKELTTGTACTTFGAAMITATVFEVDGTVEVSHV